MNAHTHQDKKDKEMTETTFEEIVISGHSWQTIRSVPNADTLMGSDYRLSVRKTGKGSKAIFEKKITRPIDIPNGRLEEVIAELLIAAQGLTDAEVNTDYRAIGGGHGHYDYGIIANMTGWIVLSKEEVVAMKTLLELEKTYQRKMREAAKLEKQAASLRK